MSRSGKKKSKREKNRVARLKGEKYKYTSVNKDGLRIEKSVGPKCVGPRCESLKCKNSQIMKCQELSESDRENINKQFWQQSTWSTKKTFVINHVVKDVGFGHKKKYNRYYLSKKNNEKIEVCRSMFINTLAIGVNSLKLWIKNSSNGLIVEKETTKTDVNLNKKENDPFLLNSFLQSVERAPSHYCRSKSTKQFLTQKFNSLKEVYNSYCDFCNTSDNTPCGRTTFEQFFYSSNLSIYVPKKDLCNKCVAYQNGVLSKSEYECHIRKKNQAKQEKINDKLRAENNEIIMLTSDAQSTKPCPSTCANVMFFHLKLNCYNNTVFDVGTKTCKNYMYSELSARACASVFTSCLCDFIINKCLSRKKTVTVWCDNCCHQNKNAVLSNSLLFLATSHQVSIIMKYLTVGHTFLECDSVHSLLERKTKNVDIFLPEDYVKIAREARVNPFQYEAESLQPEFFKDYTVKEGQFYSSLRPQKINGLDRQPTVNDIVALQHSPNGRISYKLNHEDDWVELKATPKVVPKNLKYPKLYNSVHKLDVNKFEHLQTIKQTLPAYTHEFYDSLPHNEPKNKKQK